MCDVLARIDRPATLVPSGVNSGAQKHSDGTKSSCSAVGASRLDGHADRSVSINAQWIQERQMHTERAYEGVGYVDGSIMAFRDPAALHAAEYWSSTFMFDEIDGRHHPSVQTCLCTANRRNRLLTRSKPSFHIHPRTHNSAPVVETKLHVEEA